MVLNICEPSHPYHCDPYPVSEDDIEYSWTSRYCAKCGPRRGRNVAYFAINTEYANSCSPESYLSLLTHEVTHITEGGHTDGGGHNPAFWREVAFHALLVRDSWERIEAAFSGDVSVESYLDLVVRDPNSAVVDRRHETVEERKKKMADLLSRPQPV
jgi:hypothetical protein